MPRESLLPVVQGKRHISAIRIREPFVGVRPHDNVGEDGSQRTLAHGYRVLHGVK